MSRLDTRGASGRYDIMCRARATRRQDQRNVRTEVNVDKIDLFKILNGYENIYSNIFFQN